MDDDRPRSSAPNDFGVAGLLAGESLDRYSVDELDTRVKLLEAEIARVTSHRAAKAAHRNAADALFGSGRA
jgi:uncharacterized small protein (DUF1192 family)